MIKIVALDLDGTLLNNEKQISEENKEELIKLHENGIKIVICTGRPINAIKQYIKDLSLTSIKDFSICFNGGLVVNNSNEKILSQQVLNHDQVKKIYDFSHKNNYPLDLLDFEQVYQIEDLKPSIYESVIKAPIKFKKIAYHNIPDKDFAKGIIALEPTKIDQVLTEIPDGIHEVFYVVRSQPTILEFLPKGVNKKVGLKSLLDYLQLDFSNLMAFGDASNDLDMLKSAKIGIAMGNAQSDIKAVANDVTLTNENSGVSAYLKKYFK